MRRRLGECGRCLHAAAEERGVRGLAHAVARHAAPRGGPATLPRQLDRVRVHGAHVRAHLANIVYNTVIPRNVRVSEAPSFGKPVLMYDLNCAGSQAYVALAAELLNREKEAA